MLFVGNSQAVFIVERRSAVHFGTLLENTTFDGTCLTKTGPELFAKYFRHLYYETKTTSCEQYNHL